MKLFEFLKAKEYIEKNPEAKEIPDDVLVEKEQEEAPKTQVTVEDLMKELESLKKIIEVNNKPVDVPTETNKEIEDLKASVRDLTAEMQKANAANADMPQEETADDILSNFMKGV